MAETHTTRDSILAVAKNLFAKQGYTATSMRQVAETVGIGKATIYHHFPDKQDILLTLVEANIASMHASLETIRAEDDPRQRFRVAAIESLRFLYESADLLNIARREVPGVREHLLSNFIGFYQEYLRLLIEALAKGMQMKIFRPLIPEDAALVFMTMIQGNFALVYLTGNRPDTPEKVAGRMLEIFFNGIHAPQPDEAGGQG
jgi:AcrR family transcriptional regulator